MTTDTAGPTEMAFDLIANSAPERKECLEAFWTKYSVCFEEVGDRRGIVLNADLAGLKVTSRSIWPRGA